MTLPQFYVLSEDKQLRHLLINGVCVAHQKGSNKHALLFQVAASYVEVFFNENEDRVLCTRTFEDPEELLPYVEDVDLNGLFR